MSGRLFTEVREKRGLCYAVYAAYQSMRERGGVFAYAGTTPQRAAETLEVLTEQLKCLSDGVAEDEYARAVVGLKTRLVMQGESTAARAAALASDQYLRGRPRTLDQVAAEIDAVSLDSLNRFVAEHRPDQFTTLNVGPEPLSGDAGD
jgi:predicted Zn-dependent peptidase